MRNATILWAGLLAVGLAGGGCVDRAKQAQAKRTEAQVSDPTRPVTVQPVQYRTISDTLEITGEVTTSEDTQVGAKRGGKLVAVYVNDGDAVRAGDLIASIDASDIQAQLRQALAGLSGARSQLSQAITSASVAPSRSAAAIASAQAQLRSARAQLAKAKKGARDEERVQAEWGVKAAKTNLDTAERELERTRKLVDEGAIPRARLDSAQNQYMAALTQYNSALQSQAIVTAATRPEDLEVAREAVRQAEEALRQAKAQQRLDAVTTEQVQAARAAVQSAQAQADLARQSLSDTQIRAPFSGRVAGKPTQAGTVVSPGQPIVRLIGGSGLYFEGQVPEMAIAQIQLGRPVDVEISALRGRRLQGTVAAISPLGQDVGRLFNVRVRLVGDLVGVKPGMFASGDVQLKQIAGAPVVPATAVVRREGKEVVYIAEGSKAKQVPVTVGLRTNGVVEARGIPNGALVIVRGQEDLVDGAVIKVEQPTQVAGATGKGAGG